MSKTIQHKRSMISGNKPDDTQIAVGELAINFPDRTLYTKDADGEVIALCCETDTKPLEGGTLFSEPTNTQPAGPVEWKGSGGRILTASYPLVISDDGYNFTDKIETTDNDTEIWTKWAGEPGSGDGIDGDHGTVINGTVSDGLGGSQSFELTIDKETSFVFHNFVDSDQTVGGVSESRVVTVHSANSYVYPYGSTTGASPEYAKNSGDWNAMPVTNAGSATDYMTAGDEFQLRHQDAATNNTASIYNFNMAGDSADWTTVTADVDPVILQPKIASPATDGELSISPDGPFESSDFEMAEGTDTHTASSWEIMGGVEWTSQSGLNSVVSTTIKSVTWDGTQFCAVGYSGKCVTSPDGVTWTNQSSFTTTVSETSMRSVVWDGTQFCAVGNSGKCATSPDGVTWTNQTSFGTAVGTTSMQSVTWDGSQFCAVGNEGKCATSPDGVTWTTQPSLNSAVGPRVAMNSVVWDGTQFCAVGEYGACATSPDGVTWTNQPSLESASDYTTRYSVTWDGSQFCAVGNNGKCATSPDGVTWTNQPSFTSAVGSEIMNSVIWTGSQFCAVGYDGTCATSPDGVTWTNQPSLESAVGSGYMYSVTWSGTQFCAVGQYGYCATGFQSEGASLDSDNTALTSWEPTGLEGNKDYKIRVKHHTATLNSEWSEERSFRTALPPGVTWTEQPSLNSAVGGYTEMRSVTWSGTQFCAVGAYGACGTSPDGVTWTKQTSLESASDWKSIYSVTWSGTQFCAVGIEGKCATSPDGVTWTEQPSLNSAVGGWTEMRSVTWSGTQFCAVGAYGACATSPDGVTWTNQPSLASAVATTMWSVTWSGTQFCAVGNGKCATSPDGVTWTEQPSFASAASGNTMSSVKWTGTQFCVVGVNGRCATSPDGVTWTKQSDLMDVVGFSTNMESVEWDGSQFCAVGNNGKCATSPDGVTWTNQPSFTSALGTTYAYSVVWSGSQFCAVGKDGKCVTSP